MYHVCYDKHAVIVSVIILLSWAFRFRATAVSCRRNRYFRFRLSVSVTITTTMISLRKGRYVLFNNYYAREQKENKQTVCTMYIPSRTIRFTVVDRARI